MSHIVYYDGFLSVRKRRTKLITYIMRLFPEYSHVYAKRASLKRRIFALFGAALGVWAWCGF